MTPVVQSTPDRSRWFSRVAVAACAAISLTASACNGCRAEDSANGNIAVPVDPNAAPLDITRGQAQDGSRAGAILADIQQGAGTAPAPAERGPSTEADEVPQISDELVKEMTELTRGFEKEQQFEKATDQDVKDLIEALNKSLDRMTPQDKEVMSGISTGRLPEVTLAFRNGEVRHGRIGWYLDEVYAAASAAIDRSVPLVAVFCENQDEWCGRLVADVMPCPAINRFAGHALFVWARPSINSSARQMAEALDITQYPAVVVFRPNERGIAVSGSTLGFQAARPLSRFLGTHLGEGGTEGEADRLNREERLFLGLHAPNACGESAPGVS